MRRWTIVLLLILTLPILSPLTSPGMLLSDDGPAHLVRQEAFTRALSRGEFLPRWVSELNFGFGSPLFVYNWLLPYYVGAVIQLIFQTSALITFKWTLALGTILTVLATFLWLSRFGRLAAFTGALLSVWVPYRVITLYGRATPGETWLTVFPPLILWLYASRLQWKIPLLALAWAGMFLTHSVGSLMFTPVILLLGALSSEERKSISRANSNTKSERGISSEERRAISGANSSTKSGGALSSEHRWRIIDGATIGAQSGVPLRCERTSPEARSFASQGERHSSLRSLRMTILPFIIGLLLMAFNWIPAIFESTHTTNVGTTFIAVATSLHAEVGRASLSSVLTHPFAALTTGPRSLAIGFAIPALLFITLRYRRQWTVHAASYWLLIPFSLFLMSPWSAWIWNNVPLANSILYPWRLVNVIVFASAWLTAWLLAQKRSFPLALLLIALAVLSTLPALRTLPRFAPLPQDWFATTAADVMGEYLPKGMTSDKLGRLIASIPYKERGTLVRGEDWVGLNQLAFPGWSAETQHGKLSINDQFPDRDGLMTVEIPPSTTVTFTFTETPIRMLGMMLSLLGIVLWIWAVAKAT